MDGLDSDKFENFKSLINAGLAEIKKHIDELESLITILAKGKLALQLITFRFQDALLFKTRNPNDRD
jgi:hypothetical protein